MPTTRATLRSSLTRKTDNKLTVNADLDTYLNLGENYIARRWMTFDPGRFRDARATGTSDATTGILVVDTDTTRIERLEDANKIKYPLIDIEERWDKTGYYVAGYDTTNKKSQLQIMKDGAVHTSATMYWYDLGLSAMGSTATDESILPEEYRDSIATAAAYLYYRDQGPPLAETARFWKSETLDDLAEAKQFYKNFASDPQYMQSDDPDAGGQFVADHIVS